MILLFHTSTVIDVPEHNLLHEVANLHQRCSDVTVICTQASRPQNTSRKLAMWTRYASQAASSVTPRIPDELHRLPPVRKCSASRTRNVRRRPWNQTSNRSRTGQHSLLIALGENVNLIISAGAGNYSLQIYYTRIYASHVLSLTSQ